MLTGNKKEQKLLDPMQYQVLNSYPVHCAACCNSCTSNRYRFMLSTLSICRITRLALAASWNCHAISNEGLINGSLLLSRHRYHHTLLSNNVRTVIIRKKFTQVLAPGCYRVLPGACWSARSAALPHDLPRHCHRPPL